MTRSSSTAWAGCCIGWARANRRWNTCARPIARAPIRRSRRTWARCCGSQASIGKPRKSGSRRRKKHRATTPSTAPSSASSLKPDEAKPNRVSPAAGFEVFAMRFALFWMCLLLAGCAAVEEQPAPAGPIGDAFYLSGRVSVKYGAEAASGKIAWQHDAVSDDLLFSTPLGQGVARIVRRDALVSLTTSDQKVYRAGDVETLTEQVLGWRLPLTGLPDWVRGRAAAHPVGQARERQAPAQHLLGQGLYVARPVHLLVRSGEAHQGIAPDDTRHALAQRSREQQIVACRVMLPGDLAARRLGAVFHRHPAGKIKGVAYRSRRRRLLFDRGAPGKQQAHPEKRESHGEDLKPRCRRDSVWFRFVRLKA